VYLRDAVNGKRLDVIKGEEVIHGLAFSPDSKTLATRGGAIGRYRARLRSSRATAMN
jgi:hypothetical protein